MFRSITRALPVAGLLLALGAGCSEILVTYHPSAPPPRPMAPRPAQTVEFRTKTPKDAYTVVGLLQWQPQAVYNGDSVRVIMKEMLARAGQEGCDGVMWLGKTDVLVTEETELASHTEIAKGYRMSCYVYNRERSSANDAD